MNDAVMQEIADKVGLILFVSLYFFVLPLTVNIIMNLFFVLSTFMLQKSYRNFTGSDEFKMVSRGVIGYQKKEKKNHLKPKMY